MSVQFRKLIFLSVIPVISLACCCDGYIKNTTDNIQYYIKQENLNIANNYLKIYENNLKIIESNIKKSNLSLKKIININYNSSVKDGILIKLKKYNFELKKLNKLNIY